MKKALPLLIVLLSASAFAQTYSTTQTITCDSAANRDNNGHVCTNFTTATYSSIKADFDIDFEDGKADPSNFTGAIIPSINQIDLPFDPLRVEGLVPTFGVLSSVLTAQGSFNSAYAYTSSTISITYTFTGVTDTYEAPEYYPYTWSGTFAVILNCARVYRGRCSYYSTGPGVGEMSAVNN
jgi:hypothetical protein